jgi:hypothetical protein
MDAMRKILRSGGRSLQPGCALPPTRGFFKALLIDGQRLMTKPQAESSTTLAPASAVSSRS